MNKAEHTARLVDAIGGGICLIHGEFIGLGEYHLRPCPLCDIEEHFRKEREAREDHEIAEYLF